MTYISIEIQQLALFMVLLISLLFVAWIIIELSRRRNAYERIPKLLSTAEQRFYQALSAVTQERAIIMSKVRIADLVKVKSNVKQKRFWFYFSKISQKHIDFVLLHPETFATLCLIELDDASHWRPDRMKRDRFINQLMINTGIPLIRFRVRRSYDLTKINAQISQYLSSSN